MIEGFSNRLSGLKHALPEFSKTVTIPVYLVHTSDDPEDYFFLIDFEDFVEKSRSGLFVRPKLEIWAGRDDFSRSTFAGYFRETFAAEFDRMRVAVTAEKGRKRSMGWLTWTDVIGGVSGVLTGFLGNLVLMVALSAGKSLFGSLGIPGWLRGKSATAKVESEIEATKAKVESALADTDVRLHPELYEHAFRSGARGPNARLERDAWPLPGHVRSHLQSPKSDSWW